MLPDKISTRDSQTKATNTIYTHKQMRLLIITIIQVYQFAWHL